MCIQSWYSPNFLVGIITKDPETGSDMARHGRPQTCCTALPFLFRYSGTVLFRSGLCSSPLFTRRIYFSLKALFHYLIYFFLPSESYPDLLYWFMSTSSKRDFVKYSFWFHRNGLWNNNRFSQPFQGSRMGCFALASQSKLTVKDKQGRESPITCTEKQNGQISSVKSHFQ